MVACKYGGWKRGGNEPVHETVVSDGIALVKVHFIVQ